MERKLEEETRKRERLKISLYIFTYDELCPIEKYLNTI
jgi:hypothetical protein